MQQFFQIACVYDNLGTITTRSFSVVANHAEEALDRGIARITKDSMFPNEFSIAVSLAGNGLIHRKYNWAEITIAEITAAINGGE